MIVHKRKLQYAQYLQKWQYDKVTKPKYYILGDKV